MIRVLFYKTRSPYWPVVESLAKKATRCEPVRLGKLEGFACEFDPPARRIAAELIAIVRRWKAVQVFLNGHLVQPIYLATLNCYLNAPDREDDRRTYCTPQGAEAPPCKRLVIECFGWEWYGHYLRYLNARAALLDTDAIRSDVARRRAESLVSACPFCPTEDEIEEWIRSLPPAMELSKGDVHRYALKDDDWF